MSQVIEKTKKSADVIASQQFAMVFQAYLECSDEVQAAIREMVEIVNDPEATDDEQDAAIITIAEALFPSHHNGALGADLEEMEAKHAGQYADLDSQEATFGERVNAVLDSKGMTQSDLAAAIGVGQPAVSMMLSRGCRPQRRTVEKIAEALELTPEDIWPSAEEEGNAG